MRAVLAAMPLIASALVGCSAPTADDVAMAAEQFQRGAVAEACDVLAPATLEEMEEVGPCTDVLAGLPRDEAGELLQVEVAGRSAQVRFERDVVFLAAFPDGWLVTAAGCRRASLDPAIAYDCEVDQ